MSTFKRAIQEAFDSGGLLICGLSCLYLFRLHYCPNVLGPLSFGMISLGAVGIMRHLTKELGSETENHKYEEILVLLEQRHSEIKANRKMIEKLRDACKRFMGMRIFLEGLEGDSSLIQERADICAKILEPQDFATSRESSSETPIDVEPLDGYSARVTENRAYVSVMKLDIPQEQFVEFLKEDPSFIIERTALIAEIYRKDVATSRASNAQIESLAGGSQIVAENMTLSEVVAVIKIASQKILEALTGDSSVIEKRAFILSETEHWDVATSRESIEETSSDVQFQPLVEEIKGSSENRALSEDVGGMKLAVQKEQTGRTETSIEQALQVQSNISASVQSRATEEHQKEETEKQHLKITDESQQDDPEKIREEVIEKDIIKQDEVLKDVDKTGDDGVKCNVEEAESLSKNDKQP